MINNSNNMPVEINLAIRDLPNVILMWRFDDAPQIYQDRSPHGGDEDWIVFISNDVRAKDYWMPFLDIGYGGIGCSGISEHEVVGGKIYIGAHA